MKVLNVFRFLDSTEGGGAAERTFQMSRALVRAGIECMVLTNNIGSTVERLHSVKGIRFEAFPCILKRFYVPLFSYKKVKELVGAADIVHLMGQWNFMSMLTYFVVRRLKKPYVVCPAGTLPIYGRSKIIKRIYNWIIGKRIIRNANGYIAISKNEVGHFKDYDVESNKISVIPNGVSPEDFENSDGFQFRRKYRLGESPFIIFVGRLNYIKGPDLLLKAFCNIKDKLRDYHLVFVGPDEGMLEELRKIVIEYNIEERIHFISHLSGAVKSQAYHAANLLVIPSRQEAMSIVVLEAGITGTPVLITNQCGFDCVAEVDGGIVVPASVVGIQEGLLRILEDSDKLESKGINLKNFVQNNFTWDSVISEYLKLYNQILMSCN